jgi:hypothetical protein
VNIFKYVSVILMVAVFCLVIKSAVVNGADNKNTRDKLRGIEKVYVVIDCVIPEIEIDELAEKQIRSDVWKKLAPASLSMIPGNKFRKGELFSRIGILNIKCNVFSMHEGVYGYDVAIEVFRGIEFPQDTSEVPPEASPIWSVKKFDIADELIDVKNEIDNLVDIFVSAYQSVNPERTKTFHNKRRSNGYY